MKTLNLELFNPWFIFNFKSNRHLVLKTKRSRVLVINLDWDDCDNFEDIANNLTINVCDFHNIIYFLSFEDIELDAIWDNNTLLLIEKEDD